MTKKIKIADLPEFDMAEHLPDEQAIAEYLTVVLEEDDPAALADALGIKQEEIMALGDQENDIAMIEYAGMGVAMDNAISSVKEAANFVTKSNLEDGVAYAIEKFVLN